MPTAGIFEQRTFAASKETHGDLTYAEAVAALDILDLRLEEIMVRAPLTIDMLASSRPTLARLREELIIQSTHPLPPGGTRVDHP